MSDVSSVLSLPLIAPAQAQKHVTHNEALRLLDILVQLSVTDDTLTTPPVTPPAGTRYIVPAGATGGWAGQDGQIAVYDETDWQFIAGQQGWRAYVAARSEVVVYDGTNWSPLTTPIAAADLQNLPGVGIAAASDAVNRLSVSAPATLLNHAGAGHQLKLNKAAVPDTASLLFQSNFSGRAEMGLAGEDDFSVKVSADGATWLNALRIDGTSGATTLNQDVTVEGDVTAESFVSRSDVSADLISQMDNTHPAPVSNALQFLIGGQRRYSFGINETLQQFALNAFDATGAFKGAPLTLEYAQTPSMNRAIYVDANSRVGLGKLPVATLDVMGTARLEPMVQAALPAPATIGQGGLAFVSDASGGAQLAYCNGIAWLKVRDGLAI